VKTDFSRKNKRRGRNYCNLLKHFPVLPKEVVNTVGKSQIRNYSELQLLYGMPWKLGSGLYANLGCYKGISAGVLALSLRNHKLKGRIYTVDAYCKGSFSGPKGNQQSALNTFHMYGVNRIVEQCVGLTSEWATKLADKKFKFIFIDADHSYEAASRDIQEWVPLLEEGGYLGIHDTHLDSVDQAIKDNLPNSELVYHVDTLKILKLG
jgi:predicted O-methyltransferase YrrM